MKSSTRKRAKRNVSLADVATLVGVSVATVSRVLNRTEVVSEELSEKVRKAVAELGYQPARLTVEGYRVGLDMGTLGYLSLHSDSLMRMDSFQESFIAGVGDGADHSQYHLMVSEYLEDLEQDRLPGMVRAGKVAGVVLKADHRVSKAWIERLANVVPVVLLMHEAEDLKVSSVNCDDKGAIRLGLKYLKDHGHQRVGFFSVQDRMIGAASAVHSAHHQRRLESYREQVEALGLMTEPHLGLVVERDWSCETLRDAAGKALQSWLEHGSKCPTAVMCATDEYALALMAEVQAKGLKVPEDISLVGCMNTGAAEYAQPALTSVSLNGREIGKVGVELLIEALCKPGRPVRQIVVASHLIERLSCRRLSPPETY